MKTKKIKKEATQFQIATIPRDNVTAERSHPTNYLYKNSQSKKVQSKPLMGKLFESMREPTFLPLGKNKVSGSISKPMSTKLILKTIPYM